jgi:Protein kinase domain
LVKTVTVVTPTTTTTTTSSSNPYNNNNNNNTVLPPSNRRRSLQPPPPRPLSVQDFDNRSNHLTMTDDETDRMDHDADMASSSSSDFSSDDDDSIDQVNALLEESDDTGNMVDTNNPNNIAYWIQNTIREAIYGRVFKAIVLRKIHPRYRQQILLQQQQRASSTNNTTNPTIANVEWEITAYDCAVKEMSWQHIRRERDRLAEDPIKEVCAMQYFKVWYNEYANRGRTVDATNTRVPAPSPQVFSLSSSTPIPLRPTTMSVVEQPSSTISSSSSSSPPSPNIITTSFRQMIDTNVMMPLDLLSDERHLYSIMPYCNGGELFELLNVNDRFTEPEARYWMKQVLNGIECLQHAGICHRDMSLENLLVHESGVLIIDMGMCLRIPCQAEQNTHHTQHLSTSFGNMNIISSTDTNDKLPAVVNTNTSSVATTVDPHHFPTVPSVRNLRRYMLKPQGTCGKWHYMSPEIHNNTVPFDGYAVDMWAAGVILFLMLTGFPPWDRPSPTDERFKYMSAGYLVQMLTEWEIGLSPDAMDLLQRMMFVDPKDRLSLDQVHAHPWMVNGPCQPPSHNQNIVVTAIDF